MPGSLDLLGYYCDELLVGCCIPREASIESVRNFSSVDFKENLGMRAVVTGTNYNNLFHQRLRSGSSQMP